MRVFLSFFALSRVYFLVPVHSFLASLSRRVFLSPHEKKKKKRYLSLSARPLHRFHLGLWPGMIAAALDTFLFRGRAPWTLRHGLPEGGDRGATRPLPALPAPRSSEPPTRVPRYPPPDNEVTFALSESLSRSGVDHDHDQPSHLKLRNAKAASAVSAAIFGGPEARYCPAGVYEFVDRRLGPAAPALADPWAIARAGREGEAALRISAQNCLHCKACDIKEPAGNIVWTVPEGGGGPNYTEL